MLHLTLEQIDQAIAILKKGGVIVFPTETSYGLGCDATNSEAVERIFAIKQRPADKALPVIVDMEATARKHIVFDQTTEQIAKEHWPGAVNIVGRRSPDSRIVDRCSADGFQSIRVTSHPVAQQLTQEIGPLVATSANISGQDALYDVSTIENMFAGMDNQPDAVLDIGTLSVVPASTTVKVEKDEIIILRQGNIHISYA